MQRLICNLKVGPAIDDFLAKRPTITLLMRHHSVGPSIQKKRRKQSCSKTGNSSTAQNGAVLDEEAINFYHDEDDSLERSAPYDDMIKPYASMKIKSLRRL